jgi:predicted nucleotidyltransferase
MIEKQMAEERRILEIISGSYLYGTQTETSDKDFVGIFIPDVEHILGFQKCEEVDLSVIEKDSSGKNTVNAVDRKFYEFRKFIKLAMENNPNILEILFVNKEDTLFVNDFGKELLEMRHMFPYRGLKAKFLGYAFSQKHKMVIKKDNYFNLMLAYDFLKKQDSRKFLLEVVLSSMRPNFITFGHDEAHNIKNVIIGDLQLPPSKTVQETLKVLEYRMSSIGNREELLLKYGYDVKFGSHLVRLMLEGIELLKTGELVFPLKERQMILDIKNGKWAMSKILDFSNELEKEIEDLAISSKLPSRPRTDELEEFVINKLSQIVKERE